MSAVEAGCRRYEMKTAYGLGKLEREEWKYFDGRGDCGYNAVWWADGLRHKRRGFSAECRPSVAIKTADLYAHELQ
jgi:hypothetical protein